jgi:hypothetical protein
MVSQARVEAQQFFADQLGVEMEDLVLIAETETTYTFRQRSTGQEHLARVVIGPEGPVVVKED